MAHTRKTLLLDSNWDLCLDKAGRIAIAEGAYATAQAVANECRLFTDDAYFEPGRGIPYYLVALGRKLSPSVLRARLRDAAMLVDDVEDVTEVVLESLDTETRRVTGEIQVTSREGENASIEL